MYGLVAQVNTAAVFAQEDALTAVADPDITVQNGQYIFTGPYRLLAELLGGVNSKYGRYNVAQWNGRGRPNIFAVTPSLVPTPPVFVSKYLSQPLMLPTNQQIQALTTQGGAANAPAWLLWWLATQDWTMNEPPGQYDLIGHATCSVTNVLGSWVENNAITFDQLPLGGVYVVLGANVIGAGGIAYRLNFPRTRMYYGRRLRPGGIIEANFGALPMLFSHNEWGGLGVMGAFHTFELPTFGVLGSASGAQTYDIFLKLRFLGQEVSLLDQFVQSNY